MSEVAEEHGPRRPQPTPSPRTPVSQTASAHEDNRLMTLVSAGDGAALEALYGKYSRPCMSLARRLLGDGALAQDAVQDTFLALWRDPSRFDPARGTFVSWLLAMTHHRAVDVVRREETRRKRSASGEILQTLVADGPGPDEEVWLNIRGDRVRAALADLPPVQREALQLAYFGGYTQREIAGITSTPLGTVKTRMLAGMRRLRDALDGVVTVTERPREVTP